MQEQKERFCRRPKLAWGDCGQDQVGVGLKAFWKHINNKRVTERDLGGSRGVWVKAERM